MDTQLVVQAGVQLFLSIVVVMALLGVGKRVGRAIGGLSVRLNSPAGRQQMIAELYDNEILVSTAAR